MLKRKPKDSEIIFKEIKARNINARSHQIVRKTVSDLTTKFFGIVGTNTKKRNALLHGQRLMDSVNDLDCRKNCGSVKQAVENILEVKGTGLELFLGYLIEKGNPGKVKVLIPPAEMDYLQGTDLILNIGGLNISTDLTLGGNRKKVKKYEQHCNAMTTNGSIPSYLLSNSSKYCKFAINQKNYSFQFIPNARMLLKIGQNTVIRRSRENIFLHTYKKYVKSGNTDNNIEITLGNIEGNVKNELKEISISIVQIINIINEGKLGNEGKKYVNNNLTFFIKKIIKEGEVNYNISCISNNNKNNILFTAQLFIPERTCYK